jgi:hypothetical protein
MVPQWRESRPPWRKFSSSRLFLSMALATVPEFHFFLVLWLVTMLIFASLIFAEYPLTKYMGSAAIAMTILVSGSIGPGADFVDKMITRVVLITLATMYVVAALTLLDRYVFGAKK